MKKREPISSIMTKQVKTLIISNSLKDVYEIFKEQQIHHLPIIDGNKVVGMISSSDMNKLSFGNLYGSNQSNLQAVFDTLTLEQVMTQNPIHVSQDDSIREVAELFANANFHALPVVDQDKLVGIVSSKDIIKYFLDQN